MKEIISRLMVGIFKVLVPLFYIFFVFAGVSCAIVTAVIAYQTVSDLFPKDAKIWIFSIPLLIVISFEVTKVFIIFLNKQYTDSNNQKYLVNKSWFLFLRGFLILISGIFTLLYTFYNLHNPELSNKLSQEKIQIDQSFDKQREDIGKFYDQQIDVLNSDYDRQILPYQLEMKNQEKFRFPDGTFIGQNWEAANRNVQNINNNRIAALAKNGEQRTSTLADIETKRIESIKNSEINLKSNNASSNKMINSMLEVVTDNPNYNKRFYLISIILLSILISFGLEFIIWGAFTVLAVDHGESFSSDMERKSMVEKVKDISASADAIHQAEIKTMKNKFRNFGDAMISIVKRKSKDDIKKAKEDLVEMDEEGN
jgi:hypothetical protein